jgi:hypothetical protein
LAVRRDGDEHQGCGYDPSLTDFAKHVFPPPTRE